MIRLSFAAAVLFTCAAAAVGEELEDRYHAGLRDRGLFSVAEGAALRALRDDSLTPSRRQAAAVRLALALAEHARFADGAERADLFDRAVETLDGARGAFPAMPAVRLDVTRGRVDAVAARLAANDALPDLAPTAAQRAAAENALVAADSRLSLVKAALDTRRRDLARGRSRETEPLSAEEMADLADVAAVELAEVRLLRAELQPPGSEARGRLAGAAKAAALPVRRERLERRRAVAVADAARLAGDPRGAFEALAAVPGATAARLRARLAVGGPGDAASFAVETRKSAAAGPAGLGAEGEYWAAAATARLAAEARVAGRADLADELLDRLVRDANRAAAAHGGPWGRRTARVAAVAGRSSGFSPAVAAAVAAAEAAPPGGDAELAALLDAAGAAVADENAPAAAVLSLVSRAADAGAAPRRPDRLERLSQAALDRFPAVPGFGPGSSAGVHFRLCGALGDRFAAVPSAESHEALAAALTEHRVRFAESPTAAAATWRLARHEETRDQRTRAIPLYRALLADPTRRAAAAAGLARCHEGVLTYLAGEIRRETDPTAAVARRLQRGQRYAAAAEDLVPLAEAADPDGASAATVAASAELRLRTARVLLAAPPGSGPPDRSANLAAADRLLARVRAAAGEMEDAERTPFWRFAAAEAARRGAVTAARAGRFGEAAELAADLPDDPAALAPVLAGWAGVQTGDAPFVAARLALADRVLAVDPPPAVRRSARVARAASLLAAGRPSEAATDLLDLLAAGHDPAAAALAADAVAQSRSPELAAAAADAWRRAEAAEKDGSPAWLLARARRIAGLRAAGDAAGAAKLLAVTALLHPASDHPDPRVRRRYAVLSRALNSPPVAAGDGADGV